MTGALVRGLSCVIGVGPVADGWGEGGLAECGGGREGAAREPQGGGAEAEQLGSGERGEQRAEGCGGAVESQVPAA
jgi:hypothetical protein